jgi:hypothetical protein
MFRVTHFLVADSTATDGLLGAIDLGSSSTMYSSRGRLALLNPFSATPTTSVATTGLTNGAPIQIAQVLDNTDDIEKELGMIKTGIIDAKKIVSVRKLIGSDDYTRQVKFFGSPIATAASISTITPTAAPTTATAVTSGTYYFVAGTPNRLYLCTQSGTTAAAAPTHVAGSVVSGGAIYQFVGFYGASGTLRTLADYSLVGASGAITGGLTIDVDKEYSFSVRMRSFVANTISPYGYLRGYSALASNNYLNPTTGVLTTNSAYAPFSAMFGIVKQFAEDKTIDKLAKVHAVLSYVVSGGTSGTATRCIVFSDSTTLPTYLNATQGGITPDAVVDVTAYSSWHEAFQAVNAAASITFAASANYDNSSTTGAGFYYSASLITEALEQTGFFNSADLTQFPFRFDSVKLNGYFQEGPYHDRLAFTGSGQPLNSGVTTQTPVVYDRTASGSISSGSVAINTFLQAPLGTNATPGLGHALITAGDAVWINSTGNGSAAGHFTPQGEMKFPNLMQNEVKYLAHEYQSYALKYKQQFTGVRYNALVMDPTQAKVNFAGPYVLYFIEYMPYENFAYTSVQPTTQMSIIAVPGNFGTTITNLDTIFGSAVTIQYPGTSVEVSA